MIETTIIILLSVAILLFVLSFFRKDRTSQLEKQIEDLSILHMQEMYQLKKKVRLLEEELLLPSSPPPFQKKLTAQEQLVHELLTHYEDGDDTHAIAGKTGLTEGEVERLLEPHLLGEEIKR